MKNQKITAITFEQKCEAFMQVLFKKPPQSEVVDWNNYIEKDWEWPAVSRDEIKETIFSSSIRKAAGPDKISFLILQKAFESIENRFVVLYSNLILHDYHSICWREAIDAILKKSNRKAFLSKSYRVISLLNSMTKTAEKIIASRLAYLANTTNIVNFDQMSKKKKKHRLSIKLIITQSWKHIKMKYDEILNFTFQCDANINFCWLLSCLS